MIRRPPRSTLFPYRRSSDLLRERVGSFLLDGVLGREHQKRLAQKERLSANRHLLLLHRLEQDRKSTRLNSSHGYNSYAVFCLEKKKLASFTVHSTATPLSPY